jgi:hypothetical protein
MTGGTAEEGDEPDLDSMLNLGWNNAPKPTSISNWSLGHSRAGRFVSVVNDSWSPEDRVATIRAIIYTFGIDILHNNDGSLSKNFVDDRCLVTCGGKLMGALVSHEKREELRKLLSDGRLTFSDVGGFRIKGDASSVIAGVDAAIKRMGLNSGCVDIFGVCGIFVGGKRRKCFDSSMVDSALDVSVMANKMVDRKNIVVAGEFLKALRLELVFNIADPDKKKLQASIMAASHLDSLIYVREILGCPEGKALYNLVKERAMKKGVLLSDSFNDDFMGYDLSLIYGLDGIFGVTESSVVSFSNKHQSNEGHDRLFLSALGRSYTAYVEMEPVIQEKSHVTVDARMLAVPVFIMLCKEFGHAEALSVLRKFNIKTIGDIFDGIRMLYRGAPDGIIIMKDLPEEISSVTVENSVDEVLGEGAYRNGIPRPEKIP